MFTGKMQAAAIQRKQKRVENGVNGDSKTSHTMNFTT